AHVLGFAVSFRLSLFVEDNLDDSGTVAHVKEQQIAEVAAASNPAKNHGRFTGVGGAKGSAVMRAFEVTEKVQHGSVSFPQEKGRVRRPATSRARRRKGRPLQRALQKVQELGLGEFLLRAVGQSF